MASGEESRKGRRLVVLRAMVGGTSAVANANRSNSQQVRRRKPLIITVYSMFFNSW